MSRRLADPPYLAFPLRITRPADAPATDLRDWPRLASRAQHIRGQIEQILFTVPGERVFRPEFGAGLRTLLFEPNASPLWQVTQRRLAAALGEALTGEVDPRSLEIEVSGADAQLVVRIAYTLAAIGRREELFLSGGSS
ncbi:MAG: GPW/gp25 family protein [Candidatus Accumulibacter sp.]|jgi:phage baseplate assembly protein W|uniref:GPW/gp25 family protein n=1 Tax=Accumulibacter sp. TaxID=2053492 RepID=UPI001A532C26|nr:GPW/gp25 family protein [Accumulibacter sp.]MBL8394634.1 GPW/gp25 family protein [Accumulibacter sp.]